MKERKIYRIEEITKKVGIGPFGSSIKVDTFVENGIPVISGTHLKGMRLEDKDFNFVTVEHADKLKNANVKRGDVIFTHAGNIGAVAFIPENSRYERYILSQRQFYLRCNKEKVLPEYITYYFKSPLGQKQLLANTSSVGVPSIAQPVTYLRSIEVEIPNIKEQESVVEILESLENKIELNVQMNQTLEAMAQTIFKEWFFNFNFPGFDGELVDGLPKGWKKKNLTELLDTVSITHKFPKGEAIFLNTSDIFEGEFLHNRYTAFELLPGQAKKTIHFGDILFSEIRPANKRYAFVDFESTDYVVSTKLMVLRSKGIVDNLLVYFFIKSNEVLNQLQQLAESRSGTFPQITYTELAKIEINVPSNDILKLVTEYLWISFKKIRENQIQNQTLTQIRDSLLPKLMTGKIEIDKI